MLISNHLLVIPGRDRTISPADLQGILGMIAHDQRTGTRGFPPFFPRGSSRGATRQVHVPSCTVHLQPSLLYIYQ